MRLSTFNEPFIICNFFIILIENESNPPYIMPYVFFK